MKKVMAGIGIVVIILLIIVAVLYIFIFNKPRFESGKYIEHISDFNEPIVYDESDAITNSYISSVNYTVESIDEGNLVATLTISVPDYKTVLSNTISHCIDEYGDSIEYEELFEIVKEKFASELSTTDVFITDTITVPIEKDNGKWKLLVDSDFSNFISEPIYSAFYFRGDE